MASLLPRRGRSRRSTSGAALAASRALEKGDATLQVWLDDVNAALAVHLDHPEVVEGIAALVTAGLIAPERVAEILV
ncbi:MAG: hypothetical protein NT133_12555 [Alphaproteobacteria bacterium]|nr:hypothetical protein [Alphaproteobacteria bacterium]